MVVDENARRNQRADRRNGEQRASLHVEPGARAVAHPRRRRDQEECRGPEDVDPGALDVGSFRGLEEVDDVGERGRKHSEPEEQPAQPRAPAGEREDAEDGREEQHVPERVREVRHHDGGRALRDVGDELEDHGGAERACGERGRRAVEPEHVPDRPSARTEQEDDADVQERVERDVAEVGDRRIRLRLEGGVPDFAEDPAGHRDRDDGPGGPLTLDEVRVRRSDHAGEDEEPDVDPRVEEREERVLGRREQYVGRERGEARGRSRARRVNPALVGHLDQNRFVTTGS